MGIKLCLGTLFSVILNYKATSYSYNKKIIGELIKAFDAEFDDSDDRTISHLKGGTRNLNENSFEVFSSFDIKSKNTVAGKINKNVSPLLKDKDALVSAIKMLVLEDDSICENEVVDLFNNTSKKNLNSDKSRFGPFLGGILLYVVRNTSNINMNKEVKKIDSTFFDKVAKQVSINNITGKKAKFKTVDSEAKRFCIDHNDEIDLLLLCPFAEYLDSTKADTRRIFNDFKILVPSVKKAVFKLKKLDYPDFSDDNWQAIGMKRLMELIKEYDLAEVDLFYDGFKYYHRAYSLHADEPVSNPNPSVFPRIYEVQELGWIKKIPCTLSFYIDSYIWAKENKPKEKHIPPLDLVDQLFDLKNCSEPRLTFWICRFFIDCCKQFESFRYSFESEPKIKHQDELYFLSLVHIYCLYKTLVDAT